ncbi:hypothetical protein ACMAY8_02550 [Rhodobacteraceae bacterium nBUS_22]
MNSIFVLRSQTEQRLLRSQMCFIGTAACEAVIGIYCGENEVLKDHQGLD